MPNEYFTPQGYPAVGQHGTSTPMRTMLANIALGFDKLPPLAGQGGKYVRVKADGSGLEAVTLDASVFGGDPAGTAAASMAAHVAATDPHTQYLTQSEGDARYALGSALTTHINASDPHPVYLTQPEGDARYAQLGAVPGSTRGKHAIYIGVEGMGSSATGGCAPLATVASGANQPDIVSLDFDASTQEFAQFAIAMPKSWNEGTVSFKPVWSHAAATGSFGVVWELQAVAVSDDDPIAVPYGTAQSSIDTGGTTNDAYVGPESAAITIGGTPQAEDMVFFRVARVPANGSDTLAIDARLHGIVLYITTDADTDA